MDCLFCKIAKKEIPAEIIYEDGHALAFLDIDPRAPGHTMIVSRHHGATILDLPESEIGPVFSAVKKVVDLLKNQLGPDGFTIGINQGLVSGQTVEHLHIHILPRFLGDKGGSIHTTVNNPPKEPLKEIAAKLRKT